VLNYLREAFPGKGIDHTPKHAQLADLFRVSEGSRAVHSLLLRRKFYDGEDTTIQDGFIRSLKATRVAERMKASSKTVELGG